MVNLLQNIRKSQFYVENSNALFIKMIILCYIDKEARSRLRSGSHAAMDEPGAFSGGGTENVDTPIQTQRRNGDRAPTISPDL